MRTRVREDITLFLCNVSEVSGRVIYPTCFWRISPWRSWHPLAPAFWIDQDHCGPSSGAQRQLMLIKADGSLSFKITKADQQTPRGLFQKLLTLSMSFFCWWWRWNCCRRGRGPELFSSLCLSLHSTDVVTEALHNAPWVTDIPQPTLTYFEFASGTDMFQTHMHWFFFSDTALPSARIRDKHDSCFLHDGTVCILVNKSFYAVVRAGETLQTGVWYQRPSVSLHECLHFSRRLSWKQLDGMFHWKAKCCEESNCCCLSFWLLACTDMKRCHQVSGESIYYAPRFSCLLIVNSDTVKKKKCSALVMWFLLAKITMSYLVESC